MLRSRTSLVHRRLECLDRLRDRDAPQLPERCAQPALESCEVGARFAALQMHMEAPALSPGEAPVEVARDRRLRVRAVGRRLHCLSDAGSRRFLLSRCGYGTGGGGKGTVGTVTVTVRTGVETVVEGGTTVVVTDATGAVTALTVLAAAATG